MPTSTTFDWNDDRVKLVIERVTAKNVKVTREHCEKSNTLQWIATYYAETYGGSFDFMRQMHAIIGSGGRLSFGQMAGVVNCMIAESKRRKPSKIEDLSADLPAVAPPVIPSVVQTTESAYESLREAQKSNSSTGAALRDLLYATVAERRSDEAVTPVVKNGTYTVVLSEAGAYRTLRIEDCPEMMDRPAGTQIAGFLSGPDNERDFTNCAFIAGSQVIMWARFKHDSTSAQALKILVSATDDQRADYGTAYAMESGRCCRCGRKLTVPASLFRGMGPECSKKA